MRLSRKVLHSLCASAACAALTILAPQSALATSGESDWKVTVETLAPDVLDQKIPDPRLDHGTDQASASTNPTGLPSAPFRMRLGFSDERAALQALQFALNEVGDGATFVWHRKKGVLSGTIRPTAAFVDDNNRLCRHLVYSLRVGDRTSKIEGIACRVAAGHWQL